ncbi:2-amino-4-hydroxy-6-hydroxymethyldihydropteridine diphosphokinase [Virgibacillus halodenitrificans]|uniref:2-amino-4-hydroxy-6- hydroxymethyldihydropteridine diphosphokinase n=1 Tax=Virgibacillus halodenitrificans TaxID=1482 RepID=UPI00136FF0AE|nr:2-amino-4-hydroxy-6-hydroxymethyldihydropteridine diphosphokinase [Virgibacillus halodenitrificans]MYL44324.1 2-amino-4-hydroxy-6-hydroxymethyldihydropteridine diphosphokinase [Virgibacillus halodenitrificans]
MNEVFIALGTNIEPREVHLNKAIELLSKHSSITIYKKSSIYETAPVGYTDQNDFLNMVLEAHTSLSPIELLDVCQGIEQELGRKREIRFGPRTIDLDILLYNQENRKMERLIIPHPRLHERAFVLVPLEEIAPKVIIPTQDKCVSDLINQLPRKDMKDVVKWTGKDWGEE